MDWQFLAFLAEPWFVLPWYGIGIGGFFYLIYDIRNHNTPLKQAMKWAWPIIVLFFSVLGLALYFSAARAPGISKLKDHKAKHQAHKSYEENMFRRVNGAVIHCIAGDGLGIITAMVIARLMGMSFWQEFWFEYLVGFLFGWFIFQYKSMTMMTDSKLFAMWMAFRSEFMSMLTVMGGMGLVMGYITPLVVTQQPDPFTYAFWGFAMLGLLMGYIWTWPMNLMMVKLGWKHGMGGMEYAEEKETQPQNARNSLFASMAVLGAIALIIPAWMAEIRDGRPLISPAYSLSAASTEEAATFAPLTGFNDSVEESLQQLQRGNRSHSVHALDAAHRTARILQKAYPADAALSSMKKSVMQARRALHMGRPNEARHILKQLNNTLEQHSKNLSPAPVNNPASYVGATVLNGHGIKQGEIVRINGDSALVEQGLRDVWGFVDINPGEDTVRFPNVELLFGENKNIGATMVLMPLAASEP